MDKRLDNICVYCGAPAVVQDGRYRYCVSPDSTKVKFVIAEYLAVEVSIGDSVVKND